MRAVVLDPEGRPQLVELPEPEEPGELVRVLAAALAFLASGPYPWERLITHEVGLEGVAALLADPPRDYLKAAVRP